MLPNVLTGSKSKAQRTYGSFLAVQRFKLPYPTLDLAWLEPGGRAHFVLGRKSSIVSCSSSFVVFLSVVPVGSRWVDQIVQVRWHMEKRWKTTRKDCRQNYAQSHTMHGSGHHNKLTTVRFFLLSALKKNATLVSWGIKIFQLGVSMGRKSLTQYSSQFFYLIAVS